MLRRIRLPGNSPAARILALSAILLVLLLVGRWFYLGVRQAAQTAAYLRIGGSVSEYEPHENTSDEHDAFMMWLYNDVVKDTDPWNAGLAARLITAFSNPPEELMRRLDSASGETDAEGRAITVHDVEPYMRWSAASSAVSSRLGRREPITPEAKRMLEEALLGLLDHDYWKVRQRGIQAIFHAELIAKPAIRETIERMAREDPNQFVRSAAQSSLFNHDERMARRRAGEEKPVWELREEYGLK